MKWYSKNNIIKWLRLLHRNLGYLFVGITIVYGVSGIILNHKQNRKDPAFKTLHVENQLPKMLTITEFEKVFNAEFSDFTLNKVLPEEDRYQLFIQGGLGHYYKETGHISLEVYKKKPLVYFMNKLHYNQKNYWTVFADVYAGALLYFALSGLFMVRGKNSIAKRGKWYLIAGIAIVLLFIWL